MHISKPSFSSTRWREGYDLAEVDAFVAEVVPQLERLSRPDPALAQRIIGARFSPRRLRVCYDMRSVDEYLDVLHLAALQGPSLI
jgi:hypothetical protein